MRQPSIPMVRLNFPAKRTRSIAMAGTSIGTYFLSLFGSEISSTHTQSNHHRQQTAVRIFVKVDLEVDMQIGMRGHICLTKNIAVSATFSTWIVWFAPALYRQACEKVSDLKIPHYPVDEFPHRPSVEFLAIIKKLCVF